jgi:hypothetical protein
MTNWSRDGGSRRYSRIYGGLRIVAEVTGVAEMLTDKST